MPASPARFRSTPLHQTVKGDPLSYVRPVITRDLELEWQILSRIAPFVSRELESQVDQYLATSSKEAPPSP